MANTENTFGYTKEDVAKLAQAQSKVHGGDVPAGSDAAMLQSIVDSASKNKDEIIAERQANLPLPSPPPVPSDWQSADGRTVNVGSGSRQDDITVGAGDSSGLRGPATAESDVRVDGDETGTATAGSGVGRLGGPIPSDAVTGGKRDQADVDTMGN